MSLATRGDRRWLTAAVELSRLAPPTPTNYAVGAIVVDRRGVVLATGHTGEAGARDHAEETALAKLPGGADLTGATLYSTLEPCTARRSRPGTCTALILAAGIRRVVIALREPLLFADCRGVETLRAAHVTVVEIAELAHLVREVNAHLPAPGFTPAGITPAPDFTASADLTASADFTPRVGPGTGVGEVPRPGGGSPTGGRRAEQQAQLGS